MFSGWRKAQLGDLGKVSMCKRVMKNETSEFEEVPFYKISTFGQEADSFISKELYHKYRAKFSFPNKGDILISAAGTVGKTVIYDGAPGYFQDSNIVWIANDEKVVLNSFLYYYYQTAPWLTTKGSTISRIYNDNLRSLAIKYPDLDGQNKIVNVLSCLDKKIELNNRISSELQAMAKILFDYWFVQFDFPDGSGNPYKTTGGEMVFNSTIKREIPDGWEVKNISDICDVKAGGDKPSDFSPVKTENHQVPIFSNGISDDGLYGYSSKATIERPSITVSARGTIGFSVLRINPFIPIIRLIVLTPQHGIDLKFIDETVKRTGFENSGSVQQQLTVPQISKINIVYPPQEIRERYAKAVAYSVKQIECLKNQNQELKVLRDWLLPMLMNGQVTAS